MNALKVRERKVPNSQGGGSEIFVEGLLEQPVSSAEEALAAVQAGNKSTYMLKYFSIVLMFLFANFVLNLTQCVFK